MKWPRVSDTISRDSPTASSPTTKGRPANYFRGWGHQTSHSVPVTPSRLSPQTENGSSPTDEHPGMLRSASAFSFDQENEPGPRRRCIFGDRARPRQHPDSPHSHSFLSTSGIKKTILTATNQLALTKHHTRFGRRSSRFPHNPTSRDYPSRQAQPDSPEEIFCQARQLHRRSKSLPALPVDSNPVIAELAGDFPDQDRPHTTEGKVTFQLRKKDSLHSDQPTYSEKTTASMELRTGLDTVPVPPRMSVSEATQSGREPKTPEQADMHAISIGLHNCSLELDSTIVENRQLRWEVEQLREQVGVALSQISRLKVSDQESRGRVSRLSETKNAMIGNVAVWKGFLSRALSQKHSWEDQVREVLLQMNEFGGLYDGTTGLRLNPDPRRETNEQSIDITESRLGQRGTGESTLNLQSQCPSFGLGVNQYNPLGHSIQRVDHLVSLQTVNIPPNYLQPQGQHKHLYQSRNHFNFQPPQGSNIPSATSPSELSAPYSSTTCTAITPPSPATFLEFASRTRKPATPTSHEKEDFTHRDPNVQLNKSRRRRVCHVDQRAPTDSVVIECHHRPGLREENSNGNRLTVSTLTQNELFLHGGSNSPGNAHSIGLVIPPSRERDLNEAAGTTQKRPVFLPLIPPLPRSPSQSGGSVSICSPDGTIVVSSKSCVFPRPSRPRCMTVLIPENPNVLYTSLETDPSGRQYDSDQDDTLSLLSGSDISPSYIPARFRTDFFDV